MNKVDRMVKRLLLAYPTLYHNRFEAMCEILTNSCYEWDENGCIVESFPEEMDKATPASMIERLENDLADQIADCNKRPSPMLEDLHRSFITNEMQELHNGRFIAEHIDIFASTYCGVDSTHVSYWLYRTHRYGISSYWVVNNKPENVEEEWRTAIRGWLGELLPIVNSQFGMGGDSPEGWKPLPEYKKVFNWVYDTWKAYETEDDRKQAAAGLALAKKIIAELRVEEAALD